MVWSCRIAALPLAACVPLIVGSLAAIAAARAGDSVEGPVHARVLRVIDGDTFEAEAHVWPGATMRVNVRIRGIDAPEMHSRCDAERAAALRARAALEGLVGAGIVSISNIGGAKYYGRVLADVATPAGAMVAEQMLGRNLVRRYEGGRRAGWCG